jgi:integrase
VSEIKLKKYTFNHMPWVTLVDEFDCPACPYASVYLSTLTRQAFNTQIRKAAELLFVLEYFQKHGISLVERVASGKLITQREYFQFQLAAARKKGGHSDPGNSVVFLQVSDKLIRNSLSANALQLSCVQNETQAGRLRRLRQYIDVLYMHFHDAYGTDSEITERYKKLRAAIKIDEDSLAKNMHQGTSDPTVSSIPDNLFLKMLEMILPSSPDNPFESSRIRNYLIVSILAQSGIRRGALAKIKISDLMLHGTSDQIKIYRSSIDPTDTRIDRPNQKSKAHLATVHTSLMEQMKHYINHIRSEIPGTHAHDFIFVSEKDSRGTIGQPLSLKSINTIFKIISKVLGFHLHPHLLRHKWNEVFDVKATSMGVDPRILEEARRYAMGWVAGSSMSDIYNDKRLATRSREISLAHQRRVDEQK